jgi:hypothetical protein
MADQLVGRHIEQAADIASDFGVRFDADGIFDDTMRHR